MKKNLRGQAAAALILAGLLCCSPLSSCSGPGKSGGSDTAGTANGAKTTAASGNGSQTSAAETEKLPDIKYDGYGFRILTDVQGWGIYNNEHLVVEAENGEVLNDAIYRRNKTVEERFDIKIAETVSKDVKGDVMKSVMAGDDAYDVGVSTFGMLLGLDYLCDFGDIPYIDLDKPWWDQNSRGWMSVNGAVTNMLNSMMITHYDSTVATLFNKKLAETYGCPNFYQLVRDGKWTVEAFVNSAKKVASDLNGDGVYDDNDLYGYTALSGRFTELCLGSGLNVTAKDSKDIPQLTIKSADFQTKTAKLASYLTDGNFMYDPRNMKNTTGQEAVIFAVFNGERTLFYSQGLGSVQQFRDLATDFGVLPTPKYDEKQDRYYNNIDAAKFICIPLTASDTERTGVLLEALAAESWRSLKPQYYETMLQNKYLRDKESVEMLDTYVFPNLTMVMAAGSKAVELFNYKNAASLSSTIDANIGAYQASIDEYVKTMSAGK